MLESVGAGKRAEVATGRGKDPRGEERAEKKDKIVDRLKYARM